jgi:hypothetical protein
VAVAAVVVGIMWGRSIYLSSQQWQQQQKELNVLFTLSSPHASSSTFTACMCPALRNKHYHVHDHNHHTIPPAHA